jgi:class 3 adenylate cyclase
VQPGIVALRRSITAAWQSDLRSVRQDGYDVEPGREAWAFIQRYNNLISDLRVPIQRAWGPGGLVHVADSPDIAGPGPRVSMTRVKLRNHGNLVAIEASTHSEGEAKPNPDLGLDREIEVVGVAPVAFVQELYGTLVTFLQSALSVDLELGGSRWLFEQVAAEHFVANTRWPALAELYQKVTREYAVEESFEKVIESFAPGTTQNGETEVRLGLEDLHRCRETDADISNFVQAMKLVVAADESDSPVTSEEVQRVLELEPQAIMKLGRLLRAEKDVWRDGDAADDFASWNFLPSFNVHFFRRIGSIDDFLAIETTLNPAPVNGNGNGHGVAVHLEESPAGESATPLPDGIVTFLMTDVVESTPLWLRSRSQMYLAMKRHDQLLSASIEANGGVVLKERGEGDSFFAVFLRATDALAAAVDAQRALQGEPWPDGVPIRVRMAILTGEADADDGDYRAPAVNRCAKLRRRAVGQQILVSETTYSIVADIMREDLQLVSVGPRRLEGHDRPEQIYVLQHPEVVLEATVPED